MPAAPDAMTACPLCSRPFPPTAEDANPCADCPQAHRAAQAEAEVEVLRRQVLQLQGALTRSVRCEVLAQ